MRASPREFRDGNPFIRPMPGACSVARPGEPGARTAVTGFDEETAEMTVAYRSLSWLPPQVEQDGAIPPQETNGLVTVSFSTEDIPEADRAARWRDHHASIALNVDIEPAQDRPFEACEISRILPVLHLLSLTLSPARIRRTRVTDGNDEFALFINRSGHVKVSARGRELQLAPGDGVLLSSDDAMVWDRLSYGESLSLRVPRSVLASVVVGIDDAVMQPISGQSETLKLLMCYAASLIDGNALSAPSLRSVAINHVHDLIALALGATRDTSEVTNAGGLRAARLRAAKVYIVENSFRQDIAVGVVAAHLSVTPRYLQRLFEADGTTFSSFMLGQRLARAYRMLCDTQFSDRPVGVIAYDVGFGDLSYFNRCFRRQYGATPTEIRDASAR
jgi:AraC-like DNA-binding protein